MIRKLPLLLLPLALWAVPTWSHASTVTLSGCASCNGGSYSLSYSGVAQPDVDPLHETYRITLHVDTAGVGAAVPSAVALDTASIKVSASVFGAALVSAPGALADWQLLPGGVGSQGCTGNGGGFVCADWIGAGLGIGLGGAVDFVFDITVNNGGLQTGTDGAEVKGRFVDANGSKAGAVLSNPITLGTSDLGPLVTLDLPPPDLGPTPPGGGTVPEPTSVALMVAAMLVGALARSRGRFSPAPLRAAA